MITKSEWDATSGDQSARAALTAREVEAYIAAGGTVTRAKSRESGILADEGSREERASEIRFERGHDAAFVGDREGAQYFATLSTSDALAIA